jgi:hypothetical protein
MSSLIFLMNKKSLQEVVFNLSSEN